MATGKEFATGDFVKLKSGGPVMTVKSFRSMTDAFICQWFAGKKLEQGEFPPGSLLITTLEAKDS